jgi:hypothetical protein
VFVFIGQKPQSDFVADLVRRTESGHILTGLDLIKLASARLTGRWIAIRCY